MLARYRSGEWIVLVAHDALVALPPETEERFVRDIWAALPSQPGLGGIIDLLTSLAGGSISDLPDFAGVVFEADGVRTAVRGAGSVTIESPEGDQRVDGVNVTSWNERFVPSATNVTFSATESSAWHLPLDAGSVRAAEVEVSVVSDCDGEPVAADVVVDVPAADDPRLDDLVVPAADVAADEAEVTEPEVAEADETEEAVETDEAGADAVEGDHAFSDDDAEGVVAADDVSDVPDEVDESALEATIVTASAAGAAVPDVRPDTVAYSETLTEVTDAVPAEPFVTPAPTDDMYADTIAAAPGSLSAPTGELGDHDGATISYAQARALQERGASAAVPTQVLPVATAASATGVGRVRLSSGQVAELDRTVIIGRRPRAERATGSTLPHLIAVDSPQQDISRNHLEIRSDGDSVTVVDLHTTNGSLLKRPGTDPVRLHPGEPTLVVSNDVIDLGDGITVAFEDLP